MKLLIPLIILLLALIVSLFLFGCDLPRTKLGPEMTEPAEVFDLCFVPKGHGSDTAIGYNMGKGGGVTITPVEVNIPARYAVVFKCQHGKFVIDGERGKELYDQLGKGDKVDILYCEKFEVTKQTKRVIGLHFLGAKKTGAWSG